MPSSTKRLAGHMKSVTIEAQIGNGVIVDTCVILLPVEPWEWEHRPYKYTKNNSRKVLDMKREMAKIIMMIGE